MTVRGATISGLAHEEYQNDRSYVQQLSLSRQALPLLPAAILPIVDIFAEGAIR